MLVLQVNPIWASTSDTATDDVHCPERAEYTDTPGFLIFDQVHVLSIYRVKWVWRFLFCQVMLLQRPTRFCGGEAANRQDLRKAESSSLRAREVRALNRHLTVPII